jgi:ferredoxin-NADP reductase
VNRIIEWQLAVVQSIHPETRNVKTFRLALPHWVQHRPGQHYDVRLTAPDGYQAQRSYSVASSPEKNGEIELTVERIEDGEVSTYMHDVLMPGDQIEVRGPVGGYFVWEASLGGPLLLVAGGSGVVPLMAMLRHRANASPDTTARLLYSSRTIEDVIYAQELNRLCEQSHGKLEVFHTLTRQQPSGWTGYARRVDRAMLQDVSIPLGKEPRVFVCGPTLMVESVANGLVALGIDPAAIKTERFGPSGNITGGG